MTAPLNESRCGLPSAVSPAPPSNPAEAFTAAMTSGTSSGNSSGGRMTSRASVPTDIEAKSVASAAKPTLPSRQTDAKASGAFGATPKNTAVSGTTTACKIVRLTSVPIILARKIDAGSIGAVLRPSMHRLSRSSRKVRWAPSVPAKTNDSHSPAAADSGVGFSGRANWKINSTSRPSTNSETKPVCERTSIRKSLTRICHTPSRSRGLAVVDARHFLRSRHEASRMPHQPAAAQDRGAIAYFEAATDVVGGEDDRLAAAMKANEDLLQVRDHLRVEPGVRLVEQQQIRIVQERPCQ